MKKLSLLLLVGVAFGVTNCFSQTRGTVIAIEKIDDNHVHAFLEDIETGKKVKTKKIKKEKVAKGDVADMEVNTMESVTIRNEKILVEGEILK